MSSQMSQMSQTNHGVASPTSVAGPVAGTCPECEGSVSFARAPLAAQVARCSCCGVELEVLSVSPLVLALAPEVEEDWGE
jgi:alpha-aminoadipate/glutamate carrier protein LysW